MLERVRGAAEGDALVLTHVVPRVRELLAGRRRGEGLAPAGGVGRSGRGAPHHERARGGRVGQRLLPGVLGERRAVLDDGRALQHLCLPYSPS